MTTLPPPPTIGADGTIETDVVIVGAGLAGLYAALELPDGTDIVVVDKGTPGRSGSSPWAQGGMAVALGPDDSPALHLADTLRAGDGLCDPAAVHVLATEAPARVQHLLRLGTRFDRIPGREDSLDPADLHLAREGGQTVSRSVHTADATGAEMVRVLRAAATPRVSRLPAAAIRLAGEPHGQVTGVWATDADGRLLLVRARAVLLATGGCGGLFAATTNPDNATGDGVALAHLAGAAVRDLEFVQFHPTGLAVGESWRFLLTEALRGAGATLHAADGTRFMPALHPDAELAPRHVVAAAILAQSGGSAFLDATAIPAEQLHDEFPTVVAGAAQHGFDLTTERVPVTPAAHYMVGGIRTDLDGRTSLAGLFAAGEVASTGLHGANRMAGNSLAEALVFGRRAALAMADLLGTPLGDAGPPPTFDDADAGDLPDLRRRLRQAVWHGAGPVRSRAGLDELGDHLVSLATELGGTGGDGAVARTAAMVSHNPEVNELRRAVHVADLIRSSARLRDESRGGHVRTDSPAARTDWQDVHVERIRPPS